MFVSALFGVVGHESFSHCWCRLCELCRRFKLWSRLLHGRAVEGSHDM